MGLTGIGAVAVALSLPVAVSPGAGPLYGRVTTTEGQVVEGWLRWDRNEVSLDDFLDARLVIPAHDIREAERLDPAFAAEQRAARSLVAFGTRITWEEDDQSDPPLTRAALRFAHIAAIVPLDAVSARVELRDGSSVVLRGGSTDLGRGMRRLEVVARDGETSSFRWAELERVDFLEAPSGRDALTGRRLHGTVTTWQDQVFTGDVAWDLDEVVEDDVLDGRAHGDDLEVPFRDIEAIEWESDRSANVRLRSGETLEMRGSNDVDRDNRGIEVSDPSFGRAVVHWADFRSVRFHAPEGPAYEPAADPASGAGYAPGDTLRGVVHAIDGRLLEGRIRWNNVRSRLWESLHGWSGDTEIGVELGRVTSIRKVGEDRVVVEVVGGRSFDLEIESEREAGNRAVYVTPDGGRATRIVLWRDLDRVEIRR
jgi:hypothetical protein